MKQRETFREQLDTLDREQKARTQQLADAATYVIAIDYENINYDCDGIYNYCPSPPGICPL